MLHAPHFTLHTLPSLSSPHPFHFFHDIPWYAMTSLDIPRHLSAPHTVGLPFPTWGVEEQKALPGAATAVLAHGGGGGGGGGKSQAPWVFTTEGHPVVEQDDI